MSETRVAATTSSLYANISFWLYYLSFCLPLVFLIGVPSILITRSIYLQHYPEQFVMDSPTISGTASDAPSSQFFEWTMIAVTFCIFVCWTLNLMMNTDRMSRIPRAERPKALAFMNGAASLAGILAGIFLCMLGIFTLSNGHEVHMLSSWIFYITQVLAILLDTLFIFWLAKISSEHLGPTEHFGRRCRFYIGTSVLICSLVFLFLYEVRDFLSAADRYQAQLLFVASEYVVAILCFSYPLAGFAEMRRHYREVVHTL